MTRLRTPFTLAIAGAIALGGSAAADAATRQVTVSIENLAPANSISVAPLAVAFHGGTYDPFNAGSVASTSLRTLAELGNTAPWRAAFAAGDPLAVIGAAKGPLLPGTTATLGTFTVDTATTAFFSFAAMVVPSNDFFIGNDSPTQYRLFDASGNLVVNHIDLAANAIWNAGTEKFDPSAAAFIKGSDPTKHTDEGGTIGHNFAELSGFDGLTTVPGYTFASQLAATTPVYRIVFSAAAVPEPASWALMLGGLGLVGTLARRRRETLAPV